SCDGACGSQRSRPAPLAASAGTSPASGPRCKVVSMRARTKALLAWSLWLATLGCCARGRLAALLWIRPLTLGLLAAGAAGALIFPLGYATIGLVLGLRRPGQPLRWLCCTLGPGLGP